MRYLLIIFPFLGMLDAGYVSFQKLTGTVPLCHPPFQCSVVLDSPWINFFGVPIPYLGFIFFTLFLIISSLQFVGQETMSAFGHKWAIKKAILIMGIAGFCFGSYILILMSSIIRAWCLYCLLSAINCGVLFLLSTANYKFRGEPNGV